MTSAPFAPAALRAGLFGILTLCAAAAAQDDAGDRRRVKLEILGMPTHDAIAVAMVAFDDATVRYQGVSILTDAAPVLMAPRPDADGFDVELQLPTDDQLLQDAAWQVVTWDPRDGVRIRSPQKFDVLPVAERAPVADVDPGDEPVDGRPYGDPDKQDEQDAAPHDTARADPRNNPNGDYEYIDSVEVEAAGLRLKAVRDSTGRFVALHAAFRAISDGYDLEVGRVEVGKFATDVYLFRKVPGKGEGMLDIAPHHATSAAFAPTPGVRVWLAEASDPLQEIRERGDAVAYDVIAKLAD